MKKEVEEDNRRWKDSPMLMDWYSQHSESDYITKSNLNVQHNSHQKRNDIHHKD
jgi:hypothetical protein